MSLAEGILGIIEDEAARERFERVNAVHVEIGILSHVDPEALRFCFEVVVRKSIAHDARLVIDAIPGTGWCATCAREVAMEALYDPCPVCGEFGLRVTGGRDMRVRELNVD